MDKRRREDLADEMSFCISDCHLNQEETKEYLIEMLLEITNEVEERERFFRMPEDNRIDQMMDEVHAEPHKAKHYAVMILDRSGSMVRIGVEAVDAFNQQLENIKEGMKDGVMEAEICLVTFSSKVDTPEYWCTPIDQVEPLKPEDYTPGGMTAMYDAVGYAITELQKRVDINEPDTTVLMVIISDGHENQSRRFTAQSVSNMVREMKATNRWTFTYEGANQDLGEVSQSTQINAGNMLNFVADSAGMNVATRSRRMASQAYYSRSSSAMKSVQAGEEDAGAILAEAASASFYDIGETTGDTEEAKPTHPSGQARPLPK